MSSSSVKTQNPKSLYDNPQLRGKLSSLTGRNAKEQWTRLVILGLMALVPCFASALFIFSPVPLCLAFLLYGRSRAWTLIVATLLIGCTFIFLSQGLVQVLAKEVVPLYFIAGLFGAGAAETFLRGWSPAKALVGMSLGTMLVAGGLIGGLEYSGKLGLRQSLNTMMAQQAEVVKKEYKDVLSAQGEEARELQDFLDHPEKVLAWVPAAAAAGTVAMFWLVLFMVLRNSLVWRSRIHYPYLLKDLLSFRTPDWMVYPVIVGLGLYVGSDYGLFEKSEFWGGNILYCLAPFYFFQGLGVYLDFLSFLRVGGLIRSLFVFGTVLMGWRYLIVVGLFDLWINFRRFFKIDNDKEGDRI